MLRYGLCGNAVAERDHLEKALEIQDYAEFNCPT